MEDPLLMFPLLRLMSRVEHPFSSLVIPGVETTANHTRHTTISNTWRSGSATFLFMLLFSTILNPWRRLTWSSLLAEELCCLPSTSISMLPTTRLRCAISESLSD